MAKGFGKSITNKKLRRYSPFSKVEKNIINSFEDITGSVYGEDFILHHRIKKIYAKPRIIRLFRQFQLEFKGNEEPIIQDFLESINESLEESKDLEESEIDILAGEALLWKGYQLLHDGAAPRIENDVYFYPQEELNEIEEKINEFLASVNAPENIEELVEEFILYLKKQGYYYHLTFAKLKV